MKKGIIAIVVLILCFSLSGCSSYFDAFENLGSAYQEQMDKILGNETDTSNDIVTDNNSSSTSEKEESEINTPSIDESMTDGYINGTNAKTIEDSLKAVKEYNWWDDHSLTQSRINKEWSVYCANNEYNTYTKSYDLSAFDTLEIQTAEFRTYDFDYDYLLLCASFFETDLIDGETLAQWIKDYEVSKGTVEKVLGDATFTLDYYSDDEESYVELSVWAAGDINSN